LPKSANASRHWKRPLVWRDREVPRARRGKREIPVYRVLPGHRAKEVSPVPGDRKDHKEKRVILGLKVLPGHRAKEVSPGLRDHRDQKAKRVILGLRVLPGHRAKEASPGLRDRKDHKGKRVIPVFKVLPVSRDRRGQKGILPIPTAWNRLKTALPNLKTNSRRQGRKGDLKEVLFR